MGKSVSAVVQYDKEQDEYFIEFNEEMLKRLGWKIGDQLEWINNTDGTFTLIKKEESNEQ